MNEDKNSMKFSDVVAVAVLVAAVAMFSIWYVSPPAPHPLNGEPALDVKLGLLDGGTMDLPSHMGKDVVILDFWAVWCGPCRDTMPIVAHLAEEFRDQNVVMYTINIGDEPEAIREFLEEMNLDVVVAVDRFGKSAFAYQVDALPQTVIIDRKGMITGVLVGRSPGLEGEVRGLIKTAIATG